jgi:RNA polymerase sigma-70 factor (ECF subfamily)
VTPGSESDFHRALIGAIPNVRAFAVSLCGDSNLASDLVQETLMKAWAGRDSFELGTNMKAWLFTILRNTYFSAYRRSRRILPDDDVRVTQQLASPPEQDGHTDLQDFTRMLGLLSADQREALLLVGAEGVSYEEAAAISGCPVGTMKSRVNRARARLAQLMGLVDEEETTSARMSDRRLAGLVDRRFG